MWKGVARGGFFEEMVFEMKSEGKDVCVEGKGAGKTSSFLTILNTE